MYRKLAFAQRVLRALAVKQAGVGVPLAIGAGLAMGAHTLNHGLKKSRDFKTGFQPGGVESGGHE